MLSLCPKSFVIKVSQISSSDTVIAKVIARAGEGTYIFLLETGSSW